MTTTTTATPVVLQAGVPMSHYTHMFYEFMFLQEEVKEARHHLKLLENYYRYFMDAICQDIPKCEALKSHTNKKGSAYIRAVMIKLRNQHPDMGAYIQRLQHSPVEQVAHELRRYNIDLSLFAHMDNPNLSSQELKQMVKVMWNEIKKSVHLNEPRFGSRRYDRKKTASSILKTEKASQKASQKAWGISEAFMGATAALIVGGAVLTTGAPLAYAGLGMIGQGVVGAGTALSGVSSTLLGSTGAVHAGSGLGATLALWGNTLAPYAVGTWALTK